ncbi:MAG: type II secretion system protein [bacterium]|nr:type II secretion system protein [bacterium]
MLKNIFSKNSRGFTLIELMVSLGIFSVVMLIATDGFIRSLKTERQASAFSFVNSNLSSVIEQMAKEIRTGKNFCANGILCSSSSQLSFVNANNKTVTYCLENSSIKKNIGVDCSPGQEITGENVSVQYLNFIISGNQNNDGLPPRITILVGASSKNKSASFYNVNLQTTVSSRIIGS